MAAISDAVSDRRRFVNCFQNLRSKDLSWKQRGFFLVNFSECPKALKINRKITINNGLTEQNLKMC